MTWVSPCDLCKRKPHCDGCPLNTTKKEARKK